jgi:short-subunit dehydrogenase
MNESRIATPPSPLLRRYAGWALVTGASDGLGRELASQLAAQGFDVVLVARREIVLQQLEQQLREAHGVECRVIAADLSTDEGLSHVIEKTADLDVGLLVAAAGFGSSGDLLDRSLSSERSMLRVNCEAPLVLAHHFGTQMKHREHSAIVLIGSIVGFQGIRGSANYAATKAYIQSFGEGLRLELQDHGVDVLVTAPGPINTGFGARAGMDLSSAASPQQVAAATLARLPRGGTTFPGLRAKLLGYGTRLLPRSLRSRVISSAVHRLSEANAR